MQLFGFTLLRNGVKYDYCFKESLRSLSAITKNITIALGNSEDTTEAELTEFTNLVIVPTIWDEAIRKSGLILSLQTNIALNTLRNETRNLGNAWGFYLQADEVLHEEDYELIKKDIEFADKNGYDAVAFRYNHFWLHHNQIAVGKKWYPLEVRAIKLKSEIQSEKDAQGFSGINKIYESDAFIYHYGHVRQKEKYILKKEEFHKLYHTSNLELVKASQKEEKNYRKGNFLAFLGSHPLVMKERILRFGDIFANITPQIFYILNRTQQELNLKEIKVDKIDLKIINSYSECEKNLRKTNMVILKPNFWDRILYPSKVRSRPDSHLGKNWTLEHLIMLKISEKLILNDNNK